MDKTPKNLARMKNFDNNSHQDWAPWRVNDELWIIVAVSKIHPIFTKKKKDLLLWFPVLL